MKRFLHIIVLAALVCLFPLSLSAQKQLGQYDPEALFSQGVTYFENQEYGAAQTVFERYLTLVSDKKQQQAVDAQYYEAVSALYLGKGDGTGRGTASEGQGRVEIYPALRQTRKPILGLLLICGSAQ